MFAKLKIPTPVFNQSDIQRALLSFDERFHVRALETILFAGSTCKVLEDKGNVLQIETKDYPVNTPLYIDSRFAECSSVEFGQNNRKCPSASKILERLQNYPIVPYIWGGNVAAGIPEMFSFFPPPRFLTPFEYNYWQFKGVDCSGLLYEVTEGFLPRNTKEMRATLPRVSSLKSLDLITLVNAPHVLVVLPGEKVLECREFDGLVLSPLSDRLAQLEHREPIFHRWL